MFPVYDRLIESQRALQQNIVRLTMILHHETPPTGASITFFADACTAAMARLTDGWCTRHSGIPSTSCEASLYNPSSTPPHLETGFVASLATVRQSWGFQSCITWCSKSNDAAEPPRALAPEACRLSMKELQSPSVRRVSVACPSRIRRA